MVISIKGTNNDINSFKTNSVSYDVYFKILQWLCMQIVMKIIEIEPKFTKQISFFEKNHDLNDNKDVCI